MQDDVNLHVCTRLKALFSPGTAHKRLFVLRFYGPVNPMGPCRARSVYLTTHLLARFNQYCAHSFARNWQLPFLNQRKGENDRRKYFMINLHERMLPTSTGDWTRDLLVSSRTAHPTKPPRPARPINGYCSQTSLILTYICSLSLLPFLHHHWCLDLD